MEWEVVYMKKQCITNENVERSRRMSTEKLGQFIASLRVKKDMTQLQLAELVGVNKGTVSRWESGSYAPDIFRLMKLAKVLDVTVNDLLCGEIIDENSDLENDEATLKGIQMYTTSIKYKCIKILGFILLLFVLSLGCFLIIKERSKWDVYNIKANSSEINCNGQLVFNQNKKMFFLQDINYVSENYGTDKEPSANEVTLKIYSGTEMVYKTSFKSDKSKKIHDFFDYLDLSFESNLLKLDEKLILSIYYENYNSKENGKFDVLFSDF